MTRKVSAAACLTSRRKEFCREAAESLAGRRLRLLALEDKTLWRNGPPSRIASSAGGDGGGSSLTRLSERERGATRSECIEKRRILREFCGKYESKGGGGGGIGGPHPVHGLQSPLPQKKDSPFTKKKKKKEKRKIRPVLRLGGAGLRWGPPFNSFPTRQQPSFLFSAFKHGMH